jgi:hypothetical protein
MVLAMVTVLMAVDLSEVHDSLKSVEEPAWLTVPSGCTPFSPDPGVRGGEESAILEDAAENERPCSKDDKGGSAIGTLGAGCAGGFCDAGEAASFGVSNALSESDAFTDPERSDGIWGILPLPTPLKLRERRLAAAEARVGERGDPRARSPGRLVIGPEKLSNGDPIDRSSWGSSRRWREGDG